MSFWDRLRDRLGGARDRTDGDAADSELEELEPARPSPPPAPPVRDAAGAPRDDDDIASLAKVGEPGGPPLPVAIAILRRARGSVREAEAVASALRGATERALPEPVLVACADILAARGDERQALRLLEGATSTAGLVLAADLHAANGQVARAVGTIERVLAREIDAPGAKERHARWRAALGFSAAPVRRLDEATMVAAVPTRGTFRLVREVARGGAGTVYEAEDEVLGRRIAFKVYHGRGEDRAVVEREARLAASLAGPGVCRVLDASPVDGWVALEWIGRGSVRDALRTGDLAALLPIERWARPLARVLARIHDSGIVHADVKPANVLLRQANDPVLGDFGIARPRGATSVGGSPGYVSPERLAGRASDPRDDVYGYGRVLEDVVHRADETLPLTEERAALAPWRELALRCIGPDDDRPADGGALLRLVP